MTFFRSLMASVAAFSLTALPGWADDLKIVASFSILGDMVEQVAGDAAQVTTIVGPDADAHVYQPNVADARAVAEADVIFVNGLGFETWAETLIAESGTKARVYVATDGITPIKVEGAIDPHAWNALSNGVIYVQNITNALVEATPEHEEIFLTNADAYIDDLKALDQDVRARFATLPADTRTVVTAHDAFGYLADAYDLTFLSPVGIDTEAEPSAKDLATLIDQIKAQGAAALFVENITSPVLLEQIAEETGLTLGGRLYSDALSERGGPATSYLAMFEHNMMALMAALSAFAVTSG
jgi:zinc/manganese transport system substrate-binding protein